MMLLLTTPVLARPAPFQAGGVYSISSGKSGKFSVAKVLVVEEGAVHVCLYSNEFPKRPSKVDPKKLKVAIGHVPLAEQGFRNWQPVLLYKVPIREADLEGYRMWKSR